MRHLFWSTYIILGVDWVLNGAVGSGEAMKLMLTCALVFEFIHWIGGNK